MHMNSIHGLSRAKKRAIFLAVDSMLVPLALYCVFAFRYGAGTPWMPISDSWVLFPFISMWGIGIIWALRLHRIKLDVFDAHSMSKIGVASLLIAFSAVMLSYWLKLSASRSVPILLGLFFCILAVATRLVGLDLLRWLSERGGNRKPVAIYGAGAAGIQLAAALRRGTNENTMGLLRQYFPKGSCLSNYSQEQSDEVANQLNNRPRKTLGFLTPACKLEQVLQ